MKKKAGRVALACATALAIHCTTVAAKEGPEQYPHGAESWFAGALPPPGNYFLNYLSYYSGKLKDGSGGQVRLGGREAELNVWFDALRYVGVTGIKLLGADYGVHAILPIVRLNLDLAGEKRTTGTGDLIFSPLVLGWHSKNWHSVFALDFYAPTGRYDENDPRKQIGANYYSVEPVLAVSYLGDTGWEVSAKLMYNVKRRNKDTDYKSGNEFHMDYLVGKNFGPWGVGLAGYYVKQTTNDEIDGTTVAAVPGLFSRGRKGEVFAIGPSVKYMTKAGTQFIGTWNHETNAENRFEGNKLWFKLVLPF